MENRTIFTVRPKPLPGESFWSYALRITELNGVPVLTVFNAIKNWEEKYVQRADFGLLDISPGSILDMEKFSSLTGHTVQELMHTTFHPLLTRFGVNEDVQRLRFMSGMILDSYRFCPRCLKESPYYRLLWKIAPVTSCVEHNVYLTNKCPGCSREIRFRGVSVLDVCPYCGFSLTQGETRVVDIDEREQQSWINEALRTLLDPGGVLIAPSEVAMRLLYLLCGQQPHFNRKMAEEALPSCLPTLLQHARDSLAQKRTLHLSFLLNTLYENRLSMSEFLQTTVLDCFVNSVRQNIMRKSDRLACLAPWCCGNRSPGTLVKTGTTLKRKKSGETFLYYLACTECGCEYAIDKDGGLQERTYFIKGYMALQKVGAPLTSIKRLARSIGFSEDKIRRCLAYFHTHLKSKEWHRASFRVESSLLKTVLTSIQEGTKLKVIQQWDVWESYQQFLVYRFHPEVMRALIELKRPRHSKRSGNAVKREKVRDVLGRFLEKDEDITIAAVADAVGVCSETIRNWGCTTDIATAREKQRHFRLAKMRELFYKKTEEYLMDHANEKILPNELYEHLAVVRTVLWRNLPEIASYIRQRLEEHNISDFREGPIF